MALIYDISFSSSTDGQWNLTNANTNVGRLELTTTTTNSYQTGLIEVNDPPSSLSIGDTVDISINSSNEFSGYIARIQHTIGGVNKYNVQLIGKTYDLWRYNIDDTSIHTLDYAYTTDLVREIVSSQCDAEIDYSDVPSGTGVFLSGSYEFENYTVGDAVKQMSNYDGYQFYVDSGNKLQYYNVSATQSVTITEEEIEDYSPFQQADDKMYNDVIVAGNTVSARASSQTSIDAYGRHLYKLNEQSISNATDAQLIADNILDIFKDPDIYGNVTIVGNTSLDIGKKITLDLTNMAISGDHTIKSYTHVIDGNGFRTNISFGRESYDPTADIAVLRTSFDSSYRGIFDAIEDAASAVSTADGSLVSFFQDDEPSAGNSSIGDLWFDTNDKNKSYVYSGSEWVTSRDSDIASAIANAATAQSCYDEKTETLTKNGWKKYTELTNDDEIATYNTKTKEIEYHKPIDDVKEHIYEYNNPMIHFKSNRMDIMVTPNHRMYCNKNPWLTKENWKIYTAEDIYNSNSSWHIKSRVNSNTIKSNIDNDKLNLYKLLGYYVSEGYSREVSKNSKYVRLNQKGIDTRNRMKELLMNNLSKYNFTECVLKDDYYQWTSHNKELYNILSKCGRICYEKRIPREFIEGVDIIYLNVLLDAAIDGDGTIDKRPNRNSITYYSTSKQLADDIQEIAIKCGYRAHIIFSHNDKSKIGGIWRVLIDTSDKENLIIQSQMCEKVYYKGKVHCLNVPNHIYLTRRNDKVAIQGNTADGKIVTFYQASQPTPEGEGDFWVETDNDNYLRRWNGSSWQDARHGDLTASNNNWGDVTDDDGHKPADDADVATLYSNTSPGSGTPPSNKTFTSTTTGRCSVFIESWMYGGSTGTIKLNNVTLGTLDPGASNDTVQKTFYSDDLVAGTNTLSFTGDYQDLHELTVVRGNAPDHQEVINVEPEDHHPNKVHGSTDSFAFDAIDVWYVNNSGEDIWVYQTILGDCDDGEDFDTKIVLRDDGDVEKDPLSQESKNDCGAGTTTRFTHAHSFVCPDTWDYLISGNARSVARGHKAVMYLKTTT